MKGLLARFKPAQGHACDNGFSTFATLAPGDEIKCFVQMDNNTLDMLARRYWPSKLARVVNNQEFGCKQTKPSSLTASTDLKLARWELNI